jgi:tail protein
MRTATIRGLTIGDGTGYPWTAEPAGLLSTATIRTDDQNRPRRDGVVAGDDYRGPKNLNFEVMIDEQTGPDAEAAAVALAAAFAPSAIDLELDVEVTGTPAVYTLIGRPRGAEIVLPSDLDAGIAFGRCAFMATDPILYGPQDSTQITLVDPGEGLEFPVTFPIVFSGGGSGSGTGAAPNGGTTPVDWTATLSGPLTNPRIALSGSGQFVQVSATINVGQTVVVDSREAAILLNGTAPRPQWFGTGSSWWQLQPGSNSVVFTADAGTGTATFAWRSGWA